MEALPAGLGGAMGTLRIFTLRVTETIGEKHSALCLTRGSPAEVSGWAHGRHLRSLRLRPVAVVLAAPAPL